MSTTEKQSLKNSKGPEQSGFFLPFFDMELYDFYMNDTKIGMITLSQSNEIFQNVSYPAMENIEDYTAFQYDICMDVMNNEPTIEEKMKHLKIEIAYQDHQKETLVLDFDQIVFDEVLDQPHTGLQPFVS